MAEVVALALAICILTVFNGPQWAIKMGQFGGLGFFLYVLIIVIKWLIRK
jgi:hypothetical protein